MGGLGRLVWEALTRQCGRPSQALPTPLAPQALAYLAPPMAEIGVLCRLEGLGRQELEEQAGWGEPG